MSFERDDLRLSLFFYQPDPEKPFFVAARAERLVRRAPREYFMVGRKPDGREVEVRLGPASFKIEGI